jgi:beta-phosphoglucomutase
MFKTAIFDLDGVIVDSHPVHMRCWETLLLKLGMNPTDEQLDFIREGRRRDEIVRHFFSAATDAQVEAYGEEKDLLFQQESHNLRPRAGVEEFLGELKARRVKAAVASSGSSRRVHRILELLGLKPFFEIVITGDDVGNGKPHPEIFQRAVKQMRSKAEESLVFEDSVSGIEGAKAAGIRCIGIAEGSQARVLLSAGADGIRADFRGLSVDELDKIFN